MFRLGDDLFGDFLNNYTVFETHCVLHRRQIYSGQRRVHNRRSRFRSQFLTQPLLALEVRMLVSPIRAGTPIALPLAPRVRANMLAVTGAWMGLKPLTTDATRSFAVRHLFIVNRDDAHTGRPADERAFITLI